MKQISITSLLILLLILIVFFVLYVVGNSKYKGYIEPLDKDEFSSKALFPIGFLLLDIIKYPYNSALDRQNRKYLKELYEVEFCEFYLRVYWAQGLTYSMISLILGAIANLLIDNLTLCMGVAIIFGIVFPYISLKDLEKKVMKRHDLIAIDMPEIVNKIVILTGAGLTLQGALMKISSEMYTDKIIYKELAYTMQMIASGESANVAFDHMAMKCNTVEMRRFISIILQNIHRGGSDVSVALSSIGEELWRGRKATALRLAEEASTKMLFPMMLMLFAVILLVVVPAIQSIMI